MTDKEKLARLRMALETLLVASMGEPTLYATVYEAQVKEIAREAMADIADTTPQD